MSDAPEARLLRMLDADADVVRAEAISAFDRLSGGRDIVLMGAGNLGRRALAALRHDGCTAVAFADNSVDRQGSTVDGISVLSPREAAARFPEALFVICIWGAGSPHRQAHSRGQLEALGITKICSFPLLFWRHRSGLPHLLHDLPDGPLRERELVVAAFHQLSDDLSRAEFVDQLELRRYGSFDQLRAPAMGPQYLPHDVFRLLGDEVVIDGGAFDGDTLVTWIAARGFDFSRWIAVEPDAVNRAELGRRLATLSPLVSARVELIDSALSDSSRLLPWGASGTAAAGSSIDGSQLVQSTTIDAIVAERGLCPTFVKLDIEGSELDALSGARETIAAHRPVLAVCAYHAQNHLWRVPALLAELTVDNALYMRPHNEEGFDLVCYAVPREQQVS